MRAHPLRREVGRQARGGDQAEIRELRLKQDMRRITPSSAARSRTSEAVRRGCDAAPTGEAFPHSGRRKPSVTTVEDVKKELDEMGG